MAHCGWCRPSLIWAVMLGETESTADWCLSNPLVGWLLASHTAGRRHSVCVGTARWKNHYYCGLTSVVIKKRQSADGEDKAAICATKGYEWNIMCPCWSADETNYKDSSHEKTSTGREKIKSVKDWSLFQKDIFRVSQTTVTRSFLAIAPLQTVEYFPIPKVKECIMPHEVRSAVHAVISVVLTLISRDPLCPIKKTKQTMKPGLMINLMRSH